MLKKIGYFYLITIALVLLLTLLSGLAGGTDSGDGLLFAMAAFALFMVLVWTSPVLLLVLILFICRKLFKVTSFREFFARAERFHSGGG